MRRLLVALFLVGSLAVQADYLEAYRNTNLRQLAKSGSDKVIGGELKVGELLELLHEGKQTRGYYRVKIQGTSIEGWIYRSLVKRISGDLPTFMQNFNGAEVTVVDVGAGLSCIIKTPQGRYIIYDGGNGNYAHTFLKSMYDTNQEIDLIICSHTDSDHWSSIKKIAEDYSIKKAIITSYRPDGLPKKVDKGIETLKKEPGIEFIDIADQRITPGTVIYEEGEFSLTFLSGFGEKDSLFAKDLGKDASKLRNAASIVVKLDYMDRSVLFTGDIVGLEECKDPACDCAYECISTEQYLLDSAHYYLESDVIIAPHHGARNASCPEFIKAVNPTYVVFSAGNPHKHPHDLTAQNYMALGGVAPSNILRTDLGKIPEDKDANECNNEWLGVNAGKTVKDGSFDDHIKIQLSNSGRLIVDYLD